MTRNQIKEVLRTKPYNQAAHDIHQAFKKNELFWFAITAGIICLGGIIGVVMLVNA